MEGFADRAKAAHQAETEARAHEREAERIRASSAAFTAISQFAEAWGLTVSEDDVTADSVGRQYQARVRIHPDATLRIAYAPSKATVIAAVVPAEQLYYDLEPGVETLADYQASRPTHGYTYGCYGLGSHDVYTLAEVGAELEKIETARGHWRKKHGKNL